MLNELFLLTRRFGQALPIYVAGLMIAGQVMAQTQGEVPGPIPHEDAVDHTAHHAMSPDAAGRRMHGMQHAMTPAAISELRERVDAYAGLSDQQIADSMKYMPGDYEWYISDTSLQGKHGVLILVHGFGDYGDEMFKNKMQPLAASYPTAFAFGMAMMMSDHIQLAVDDLVASGATDIVVVPAVSTRYNTLMRQWQYIFGLADEPSYAKVPRIMTAANIRLILPPEDQPLIADIIVDYAREISKSPANEVVIIVGHGPEHAADNQLQLAMMEHLAAAVQDSAPYVRVQVATLQDDAPKEVRAANVVKLRGLVEKAVAEGHQVLLVTNLLGTRTVQPRLKQDLAGLGYFFNTKGLTEHENFAKWVDASAREALAGAAQ